MNVSARVSWRVCVSSLVVLALLAGAESCGTSQTSGARPPDATQSTPQASPASRKPTPREPHAYRVIARVEHRLLANFALLRTRPEGLPALVQRVLRAPTFGLNWKLAERIPVALPSAYWLVPGNGYLCIVARESMGVGTTCAPSSEALVHGIASITITPFRPTPGVRPSRLIVGVAPDGTHEVLVHTRGEVDTGPVVNEVFVLRDSVDAPPDFLALRR